MSSGFAADLLSLTEPNRPSSRQKSEMPPSERGVDFAGVLQTTRQGGPEQAEDAEAGEVSADASSIARRAPPYMMTPGELDIEASANKGEETPELSIGDIEDASAADDVLPVTVEMQGDASDATSLPTEEKALSSDITAPADPAATPATSEPVDQEQDELQAAALSVSASDAPVRTNEGEAPVADTADTPVGTRLEAAADPAKPGLAAKADPEATDPETAPAAEKTPKSDTVAAAVTSNAAAPVATIVAQAVQPGQARPAADSIGAVGSRTEQTSGETVDVPAPARARRSADTAAIPHAEDFAKALASESGLEHSEGIEKSGGAAQAGLNHSASPFALATAPGLSGQPVGAAAQILPNPVAMTATATMIAAPEEIVDIFTNKLAGADKPERITVQLDPPELGRISIEFKFDAQGLQHVAVTSDTPEAMQRLRMMHADLVQSLEQHGLNARDMSFSQNTPQRDQNMRDAQAYSPFARQDDAEGSYALPPVAASRQIRTGSGGLNIKL